MAPRAPDVSAIAPSTVTETLTIGGGGGGVPGKAGAPPQPQKETAAAAASVRSSADKERKIFLSLSYIIIAYLICWSPFHFCFDALYFDENSVSYDWYSFATLCCYFNSTLNPLLYACASKDFRTAFRDILLLKHCRA